MRGLLWLRINSLFGLGISEAAARDQEVRASNDGVERLHRGSFSDGSLCSRWSFFTRIAWMLEGSLSSRWKPIFVFGCGQLRRSAAKPRGPWASQAKSELYEAVLVIRADGGPKEVSIPFALKEAGGLREDDLRSSRDEEQSAGEGLWSAVLAGGVAAGAGAARRRRSGRATCGRLAGRARKSRHGRRR